MSLKITKTSPCNEVKGVFIRLPRLKELTMSFQIILHIYQSLNILNIEREKKLGVQSIKLESIATGPFPATPRPRIHPDASWQERACAVPLVDDSNRTSDSHRAVELQVTSYLSPYFYSVGRGDIKLLLSHPRNLAPSGLSSNLISCFFQGHSRIVGYIRA